MDGILIWCKKCSFLSGDICILYFSSYNRVDSFKPHYLVYENEDDLIKNYKSLIKILEDESEEFASLEKKDAILSVKHDELSAIFQSYSKPKVKMKKSESNVKQAYNFFLGMLSKELDLSFKDTKEKIDSLLECKQLLAVSVRILLSGGNNSLIQSHLDTILNKLSESKILTILNLNDMCTSFRIEIASNESIVQEKKDNLYIGTIHSVKGETHRSTMLVLNSDGYCGCFLPPMQSFLPPIADKCTTLCEIIYQNIKKR